ncbi:MAG TPA: serine hydrolase domain-containing protein, partial [Steroidobacter sp.]
MRMVRALLLLAGLALQPLVSSAQVTLTSADLETYLDGFVPYALQRGDIAGAVVSVVKDGEVLLLKGYGVSDVATGEAVDPNTTMFRPGSISKMFTATAV